MGVGETADDYLKRHSVRPIFEELLDNCCKELPDALEPFLLDQLASKFTAAADAVGVPAEARAWKQSGVQVYKHAQLMAFLDDLRWAPTVEAIVERVVFERPKNPTTFMIELLAKGDVAPVQDETEELENAAARLQARQRGNRARKERAEQQQAATRVQAARRGKGGRASARQKAAAKAAEAQAAAGDAADAAEQVEQADAEVAEAEDEAAALDYLGDDPDAQRSATKMQAIQRGKKARQAEQEKAAAATKMQARQRGRKSRSGGYAAGE